MDGTFCQLYRNNKCCMEYTNFPYNIYSAETVQAPAYFKGNINNPCAGAYEFLLNPCLPNTNINPKRRATYGWIPFPNGYGYGNFHQNYNCYEGCDPDPEGFSPYAKDKYVCD